MRLVLIHGRDQGASSKDQIRDEWLQGLEKGFQQAGERPQKPYTVNVPFYGSRLDELTQELNQRVSAVIEKGERPVGQEIDDFIATLIEELANGAGVQPDDAEAELQPGVLEKGPERLEWIQALARSASHKLPWLADFGIGRFAADVQVYLTRPHIQKDINTIVASAIQGEPCVVVAHSLGTVVAYITLTEAVRNPQVKLLVTAGSPLGIRSIKSKLRRPLKFPEGVQNWFNAADERDIIALYSQLDGDSFVANIDNHTAVKNGADSHSIAKYLEDATVAKRIAKALS